jgi:sugar phosphate permease
METPVQKQINSKIFWRLLPFCMILYVIAAIDRTNVSFAALQMNQRFGFSGAVFGFGAGVFFLGYALFEIPSNLILARVGARRWISRIMISWGVVVIAMAWTRGEYSFYLFRFLLGVAEAGFLPGLLYYFNNWVPRKERAKTFASLLCGTVVSNIIAGPLAGGLMTLDGLFGMAGWQIMLVTEGIPALIFGLLTLGVLTEKPDTASWLSAEEKTTLRALIESQEAAHLESRSARFREVLQNANVWKLIGFCFFLQLANYGVLLWLPQIIRSLGQLSTMQIGFLSAGPYVLGAICMVLWGRHSDHTGERKWHLIVAILAGAIGLAWSALAGNPILGYVGLCVAAAGITSTFGVFWALPGDYLQGLAAAGGLAFINSVGITGAFVGPYVVGFVRDRTPGFTTALLLLAGSAVVASLFALSLRVGRAVAPPAPESEGTAR